MSKAPLYFLTPSNINKLLSIKNFPETLTLSLNVGRSTQTVTFLPEGLRTASGVFLPLSGEILSEMQNDSRTIWIFRGGSWKKWQHFHERTGQFYKLVFVAADKPPTIEISSVKMHVTRDGDPLLDTRRKLRSLGKVGGVVLDTCCGPGYTAIALSRLPWVQQVLTIEISPVMLQICRENPWSAELFNSSKIQVIAGDAVQLVQGFPDNRFNAVLHDPPRFALAPALYETRFYSEIYRLLKRGGKLYHYTGDPRRGASAGLPERTAARLKTAGFSRIGKCYQGVCARKL